MPANTARNLCDCSRGLPGTRIWTRLRLTEAVSWGGRGRPLGYMTRQRSAIRSVRTSREHSGSSRHRTYVRMVSAARCLQGSGLSPVVGDDPIFIYSLYTETLLYTENAFHVYRVPLAALNCFLGNFLGRSKAVDLKYPFNVCHKRKGCLRCSAVRLLFSMVSQRCRDRRRRGQMGEERSREALSVKYQDANTTAGY